MKRKKQNKKTLKHLSYTDYSPSTKHKHEQENCKSLHAGSFFTPRIIASALAKLSVMTDKYEFVLHFEVAALWRWQFDERATLIHRYSLLESSLGKKALMTPHREEHMKDVLAFLSCILILAGCITALCPYLSTSTRYKRGRCACVLVNERLDPSFERWRGIPSRVWSWKCKWQRECIFIDGKWSPHLSR